VLLIEKVVVQPSETCRSGHSDEDSARSIQNVGYVGNGQASETRVSMLSILHYILPQVNESKESDVPMVVLTVSASFPPYHTSRQSLSYRLIRLL
jgi:hypothetical protein